MGKITLYSSQRSGFGGGGYLKTVGPTFGFTILCPTIATPMLLAVFFDSSLQLQREPL